MLLALVAIDNRLVIQRDSLVATNQAKDRCDLGFILKIARVKAIVRLLNRASIQLSVRRKPSTTQNG